MEVIYIQCPNCGKGWYAERENDILVKTGEDELVDLTSPCHCFDCGHKYIPLSLEVTDDEENAYMICINEHSGIYLPVRKNTNVMKMQDWVAKALTTCRSH